MTEHDELQALRARVEALEKQGTASKLAELQSKLDKKERGNRIWATLSSLLIYLLVLFGNDRLVELERANPTRGLVTPMVVVSSGQFASTSKLAPGQMWVSDNKQSGSSSTDIVPCSLLFQGRTARLQRLSSPIAN